MVLFRETFHCGHEGLDLSLQCSVSRRLVSLNVVGGSHQASEYHETLLSGKRLVWLNSCFSQMAPTDDVINLTNKSHDSNRSNESPAQKERKHLTESTGVVPAKYPPKVKLELFSQL